MFIIGLVFIILSFVVIGQFVFIPIMYFFGLLHNNVEKTQNKTAKEQYTKENGDRSLKLLEKELKRVAGPNKLTYKNGKYVVNLYNSSDYNVKAAKKQFKLRGITNYKVK